MTAPVRTEKALLLSLVHPDFLPSVYSLSFVLRDKGYDVDVVSFSSPVRGPQHAEQGITLHDCGPYAGSASAKAGARRNFRMTAQRLTGTRKPAVIIATCPFSFLEALRLRGEESPVVYYMLETYEARRRDLFRSPRTTLRSWRALRHVSEADLVCTPSPERSGWLAGVARMRRLPATVLNSPSFAATRDRRADPSVGDRLLPSGMRSNALVIHTGAVSATQAVLELVESVAKWPAGLGLVVTNVGNSAYGDAVRSAAAQSVRSDSIALLPTVTRQDMLALQSMSSLGVCLLRPGDNLEAMMPAPNKVGEYLHSGLTIVGVRMPYLNELEIAGVAVLAERLTPDAIASAVARAWETSGRASGRTRALSVAGTWYCMETQARPILQLIERDAREDR